MSGPLHPVVRSGLLLGLVALLGTALLAAVNNLTADRIAEQERQVVLRQLREIIPDALFNNTLLEDTIDVSDDRYFPGGQTVRVYRARKNNGAVAVIMNHIAPDGYNGDIRLLTGISANGRILGVRVINHRETPGLGDPIELAKSRWILGFDQKSLSEPTATGWAVRRDGGQFDQFTGATITPRAVVRAVHNALLYFDENRQALFELPPGPTPEEAKSGS